MKKLYAYDLPSPAVTDAVAGQTAVVIDVLRATTTITHALEAGAIEVLPCLEVEDAQALAATIPEGRYVLGGERGGLPIPGFHLGNSPAEYTPQSVGGKTVIFTTTNGTRAMMLCRRAARVFLGAFVNASAVLGRLADEPEVHLLCAGSGGQPTHDDVLLAGYLAARLAPGGDEEWQLIAGAVAVRDQWTSAFPASVGKGATPPGPEPLAAELRKGRAGQKLLTIGLGDDILAAARIDRFQSVPAMDPRNLRIGLE